MLNPVFHLILELINILFTNEIVATEFKGISLAIIPEKSIEAIVAIHGPHERWVEFRFPSQL